MVDDLLQHPVLRLSQLPVVPAVHGQHQPSFLEHRVLQTVVDHERDLEELEAQRLQSVGLMRVRLADALLDRVQLLAEVVELELNRRTDTMVLVLVSLGLWSSWE